METGFVIHHPIRSFGHLRHAVVRIIPAIRILYPVIQTDILQLMYRIRLPTLWTMAREHAKINLHKVRQTE